jgi:dTDP-4-dehydrorhamnose reductase
LPFDIRQPDLAALRLEETGHQAVLIASAKPNIAYCQQQAEAAQAVNVTGTLELIRRVGRTSMQVIFISSDYVFAGRKGPYDDDAETRPTTEYGRQKAAVEKELPNLAANYLVLRLSKIVGITKGDGTLLDEMASSMAAGRPVRAARDQVFCPTYVDDLVRAVLAIQTRRLQGVMNVCNAQGWSRCDVALALAWQMGVDLALVEPISLYDIPSMAGRPLDTSMACSRLAREVGASFTPLPRCIEQYVTAARAALA